MSNDSAERLTEF